MTQLCLLLRRHYPKSRSQYSVCRAHRDLCRDCQVKYELLWGMLGKSDLWRQLALSLALNWLVGPALMVGLAWDRSSLQPHASQGGYPECRVAPTTLPRVPATFAVQFARHQIVSL